MELRRSLFSGLIAASLLSGCSLFAGEEEAVKMAPLPVVKNQFNPQQLWRVSVGDGVGDAYVGLKPALEDGTLYVADRNGVVKALTASEGKEKWQIDLGSQQGLFSKKSSALLSGGLTAVSGHVYVGSERAYVYALNATDGSVVWKAKVAGEALSHPVVSEGVVLIHTGNGMLQALDERTGIVQWTVNLEAPNLSLRGESAPAIAYGAAIVGDDSGRVTAVAIRGGELIWKQSISQATRATEIDSLNDVDSTAVILDGVVYAQAYNGDIAALELRTGQILWKRDIGSTKNFIVEGDYIYLVDQDDRIVSLRRDSGVVVWKQSDLLNRDLTAPVFSSNTLVVGDKEGYLHWLSKETGRLLVQTKVNKSGFQSGFVVAEGRFFVQARDGSLYAFTH